VVENAQYCQLVTGNLVQDVVRPKNAEADRRPDFAVLARGQGPIHDPPKLVMQGEEICVGVPLAVGAHSISTQFYEVSIRGIGDPKPHRWP
jgi:hypothetical protein